MEVIFCLCIQLDITNLQPFDIIRISFQLHTRTRLRTQIAVDIISTHQLQRQIIHVICARMPFYLRHIIISKRFFLHINIQTQGCS